jgi:predicted nucleic acid-binding protein
MLAFETLAQNCVVLPFDDMAADVAATIWASCSRSQRQNLGDVLIAAIAVARQIPLVSRNKKDFEMLAKLSGVDLHLVDWTKSTRHATR